MSAGRRGIAAHGSLSTINGGIIGAGRIGRIHCEHLSSLRDVEIVGVCDANLSAAQQCADAHGVPLASSDHRVLLNNSSLDAIVICSPTDTHLPLVEEAATLGKHVFCEKPLGFDLEKIDAVLRITRQAKIKFQVGFNRRFDPHFAGLRETVAANALGPLQFVRITSRDPNPPPLDYIKRSGGIFVDMAIHDFDMLRFVVNETPERVFAVGSVLVDQAIGSAGDFDTAVTTLRFPSGVLATIENCRQNAFGFDQRMEVFGMAATAAVGNIFPTAQVMSDSKGVHNPCPYHFFAERYHESYYRELRAFIDCLVNDTPPGVTGEDARLATALGLAAGRSAQEHREVALKELISEW